MALSHLLHTAFVSPSIRPGRTTSDNLLESHTQRWVKPEPYELSGSFTSYDLW